jgi:hypothetical protein
MVAESKELRVMQTSAKDLEASLKNPLANLGQLECKIMMTMENHPLNKIEKIL